jgi:hypothetical protein
MVDSSSIEFVLESVLVGDVIRGLIHDAIGLLLVGRVKFDFFEVEMDTGEVFGAFGSFLLTLDADSAGEV